MAGAAFYCKLQVSEIRLRNDVQRGESDAVLDADREFAFIRYRTLGHLARTLVGDVHAGDAPVSVVVPVRILAIGRKCIFGQVDFDGTTALDDDRIAV
jgi:hypothetical protein